MFLEDHNCQKFSSNHQCWVSVDDTEAFNQTSKLGK